MKKCTKCGEAMVEGKRCAACDKAYRDANRGRKSQTMREYYVREKDGVREYYRAWYEANRKDVNARRREKCREKKEW